MPLKMRAAAKNLHTHVLILKSKHVALEAML